MLNTINNDLSKVSNEILKISQARAYFNYLGDTSLSDGYYSYLKNSH
jgi:hypothetical protein